MRLARSGIDIGYYGTINGNTNYFDSDYGNIYIYGAVNANTNPYAALFKPEEAWNIDTKMDDGLPSTGNWMSFTPTNSTTPHCAESSAPGAGYKLTYSSAACPFIIKTRLM